MPLTLTSHGTTLGHTGVELTGLAPGTRGWYLQPSPSFESVGPVLLELQQATEGLQELMPSDETLAAIREEERAAFVRHAMLTDPGAPRFLELVDAVEAMALELRDESGVLVPTRTLGVTQVDLSPRAFRELLVSIDPGADPALSETPPFYLLVAGL
jgi:hypothetical protein